MKFYLENLQIFNAIGLLNFRNMEKIFQKDLSLEYSKPASRVYFWCEISVRCWGECW